MPNYPGAGGATSPVKSNLSPIVLFRGENVYLFGVLAAGATQLPVNDTNVAPEAATAGAQASIAGNIQAGSEAMPQPGVSIEVRWAANPGAGESIQVQEADTDADAFYTNLGSAITFSSALVARLDLTGNNSPGGRFLRVVRTPGANAVAASVKLSRLA